MLEKWPTSLLELPQPGHPGLRIIVRSPCQRLARNVIPAGHSRRIEGIIIHSSGWRMYKTVTYPVEDDGRRSNDVDDQVDVDLRVKLCSLRGRPREAIEDERG